MKTIFGMKVQVVHPQPRYVLPDDVPPPPGMTREEFAAWSAKYCGVIEPFVRRGEVYQLHGDTLVVHYADWEDMKKELARHERVQAGFSPRW